MLKFINVLGARTKRTSLFLKSYIGGKKTPKRLRGFVLHLGAHKTGTSLIQKYLRDNKSSCAKAGVFAMPRSDGDAFIGMGREYEITKGAEELLNQVNTAVADGATHYILSHENSLGTPFITGAQSIYANAQLNAVNLKKALGEQPWRVVYYIRNQADFLESYYLQTIHEGKWHSFEDFLKGINVESLSWLPLYHTLCETFGEEHVVIRSFENDISAGQSAFLENFLRAAAVPDLSSFGDFHYKPSRNLSISSRGLELAYGINPLLENNVERKLFRRFLQSNFSNKDHPRPVLLESARKNEIRAYYENENLGIVEAAASSIKPVY